MINLSKKPAVIEKGKRPALTGNLAHKLSSDPFLDWMIILAIALVTALALVAVGVSVYLGSAERLSEGNQVSQGRAVASFDESKLDKVIHIFDARADERSSITRGYRSTGDPSLQ